MTRTAKASPKRALAVGLVGLLTAWAFSCAAAAEPGESGVTVVPRAAEAQAAFDALALRGLWVVQMGRPRALLVPEEFRHRAIDGQRLAREAAKPFGLQAIPVRDGRGVIICAGANEADIERAKKDSASPDAMVRMDAVLLAGRLEDPRIVPLLLAMVGDKHEGVADLAGAALRRAGWPAVAVVSPDLALPLIAKDLVSKEIAERRSASAALRYLEANRIPALAETALADRDVGVAMDAATALGWAAGEQVAKLLQKALAHRDSGVGQRVSAVLDRIGAEQAMPLIEQAMGHVDGLVAENGAKALGRIGGDRAWRFVDAGVNGTALARARAMDALGQMGGEKALAILEAALKDKENAVRCRAVAALGQIGGDRAFALLERVLTEKPPNRRQEVCGHAARALALVGGEKAVALISKVLDYSDPVTSCHAVWALGQIGGPEAEPVLLKALADRDGGVRNQAAKAAGLLDAEKARKILLGVVKSGKEPGPPRSAADILRERFPDDPEVKQVLKEKEALLGR